MPCCCCSWLMNLLIDCDFNWLWFFFLDFFMNVGEYDMKMMNKFREEDEGMGKILAIDGIL